MLLKTFSTTSFTKASLPKIHESLKGNDREVIKLFRAAHRFNLYLPVLSSVSTDNCINGFEFHWDLSAAFQSFSMNT